MKTLSQDCQHLNNKPVTKPINVTVVHRAGSSVKTILSTDGLHAYELTGLIDGVKAFECAQDTNGRLDYIMTLMNGRGAIKGLSHPSDMALSSEGKDLYVVGWDSILHFRRDIEVGSLAFLDRKTNDKYSGARTVILTPDGRHVLMASLDYFWIFSRVNVQTLYQRSKHYNSPNTTLCPNTTPCPNTNLCAQTPQFVLTPHFVSKHHNVQTTHERSKHYNMRRTTLCAKHYTLALSVHYTVWPNTTLYNVARLVC